MEYANILNACVILCDGCTDDFTDIHGIRDKIQIGKDCKADFFMVVYLDFLGYVPIKNKIRLYILLQQEGGGGLIKPLADLSIVLSEEKDCTGDHVTCRVPVGYNLSGTDFPGTGSYSIRVYDISNLEDCDDVISNVSGDNLIGAHLFDVIS